MADKMPSLVLELVINFHGRLTGLVTSYVETAF